MMVLPSWGPYFDSNLFLSLHKLSLHTMTQSILTA